MTATVAPVVPGGGTPSGQIVFKEGRKTIGTAVLSNGQASIVVTNKKAGNRTFVATYAGDARFIGSASQPYVLVVTR